MAPTRPGDPRAGNVKKTWVLAGLDAREKSRHRLPYYCTVHAGPFDSSLEAVHHGRLDEHRSPHGARRAARVSPSARRPLKQRELLRRVGRADAHDQAAAGRQLLQQRRRRARARACRAKPRKGPVGRQLFAARRSSTQQPPGSSQAAARQQPGSNQEALSSSQQLPVSSSRRQPATRKSRQTAAVAVGPCWARRRSRWRRLCT